MNSECQFSEISGSSHVKDVTIITCLVMLWSNHLCNFEYVIFNGKAILKDLIQSLPYFNSV